MNVPKDAFTALYRAYVRLLQSGKDRIESLGGKCDPVDVMERRDPALIEARGVLLALAAAPPAQEAKERPSYEAKCVVLGTLVAGLRNHFPDFPDCDGDDAENDVLRGIIRYVEEAQEPGAPGREACERCGGDGWGVGGGLMGKACDCCNGTGLATPPAAPRNESMGRGGEFLGAGPCVEDYPEKNNG